MKQVTLAYFPIAGGGLVTWKPFGRLDKKIGIGKSFDKFFDYKMRDAGQRELEESRPLTAYLVVGAFQPRWGVRGLPFDGSAGIIQPFEASALRLRACSQRLFKHYLYHGRCKQRSRQEEPKTADSSHLTLEFLTMKRRARNWCESFIRLAPPNLLFRIY